MVIYERATLPLACTQSRLTRSVIFELLNQTTKCCMWGSSNTYFNCSAVAKYFTSKDELFVWSHFFVGSIKPKLLDGWQLNLLGGCGMGQPGGWCKPLKRGWIYYMNLNLMGLLKLSECFYRKIWTYRHTCCFPPKIQAPPCSNALLNRNKQERGIFILISLPTTT